MIASDTRADGATKVWIPWVCWGAWSVLVLGRYYAQLWDSFRHPSDLSAIAISACRQTLYCAVIGAAMSLLTAVAFRVWRVARTRLHRRATPAALTAAGAFAIIWAREHSRVVAALATVHLPHAPAIGEAAARAANGICGALLVALASYTLGRFVVASIRLNSLSTWERRVVVLTLGAGALSMSSLALALTGLYRPFTVALLIGGVLVVGALVSAARRDRGGADAPEEARRSVGPVGLDKAWFVLAFLALSFGLVGALAPETEYDALWYHLNVPRLWLEAGRPIDLLQEFPSLYPFTWELVYGAGLTMGGVVAAKLLHFGCLLVLSATAVLASRRYSPACSPYVVVALLVTAPTVLWESTTAYNDLALAMFASLACYALARYAETAHRPWLAVAGLEFGFAAATKHLGLVLLAAALAVLTWEWLRRCVPFARLARVIAIVTVIAIVLPLPWYIRAWHYSGNPFFPELYGLFGGGPSARWNVATERGLDAFKAHFGMGRGVWSLIRLPWDATVHAALFGGSFGPLWLVLIPACVIGRRGDRALTLLAVGALAYMAVWASPLSSFQMRFLVPAAAALAILGAEGWRRLVTAHVDVTPKPRRIAAVALLTIAFLDLPPFITLHEADRVRYSGWLTHVLRTAPVAVVTGRESEMQYLTRSVPSYAVWQYANSHLPADASVLTFTEGDNLYAQRTRYPEDAALMRRAVWEATSDADVFDTLHRLGIEYVIFNRRQLPQLRSYGLRLADDRIQRACATLYDDGRYRLCRLPPASDPSAVTSRAASGALPGRAHLNDLRNTWTMKPRG